MVADWEEGCKLPDSDVSSLEAKPLTSMRGLSFDSPRCPCLATYSPISVKELMEDSDMRSTWDVVAGERDADEALTWEESCRSGVGCRFCFLEGEDLGGVEGASCGPTRSTGALSWVGLPGDVASRSEIADVPGVASCC